MTTNVIHNKNRLLGINERNYGYVKKYNSRSAKEIADDKILTKKVLDEAGVPTTKILAVIKNRKQLDSFDFNTLPKSFVIKPVNGVEGGGIEIVFNRDKTGNFICSKNGKMSEEALRAHISYILEGRFSHSFVPDQALIEERVQPHKKFRPYIFRGTPDVRILVFRGIPVMAMIRWPTRESGGKANLSQGAVGSGIDIATGVTTHSMQEDENGRIHIVDYVHNSHVRYSGFKIPYWDRMLSYAITASRAAGLGFAAVDFLVDRKHGPLVVELNARPGLRIQITNQDGLKWRLEQVKYLPVKSDIHAIRLGKDLFGGEVEEEIQAIAGKKLISLLQPIKMYHRNGIKSMTVKAKVDTGATYSSIDTKLAKELGYGKAIKVFESYNFPDRIETRLEGEELKKKYHDKILEECPEIIDTEIIVNSNGRTYRMILPIEAKVQDKVFTLHATVTDRSHLSMSVLLGKKDLKDFLIDPSKK